MEVIYKHTTVALILANYPKTHWKNVILALAIYGIQSLKKEDKLSSLTIDQIEEMCNTKQNRTNDLTVCIKELNTIKKELSKLDKRFDERHGNKENEVVVPIKEVDTKVQSLKKPKDEAKAMASRPSSAWRSKGTTNRNSSKQMKVYPTRWPKATQDNPKNEKARSTAIMPIRTKRSVTVKKAEGSASKGNTKNLPTYLKNVQSKILGNIEQAKADYMKKRKEEQLRTEQLTFNNREGETSQVKRSRTQELNKDNSLFQKQRGELQVNERAFRCEARDKPVKYEPSHVVNDQNNGNEISNYLRRMKERIATLPNEPEEVMPNYTQPQEIHYNSTTNKKYLCRDIDYKKEADKYTGSYIIEHFSRQNVESNNRQPCYNLDKRDTGLKYEDAGKYSIEPYNVVQCPNSQYNEIRGTLYSESINTPEQRFHTLAKPIAVSVDVVKEKVR